MRLSILHMVMGLLLLLQSALAYGEFEKTISMSWQKIKDAKAYEIEVSQKNPKGVYEPVHKEVTKDNSYSHKFPPGEYRLRMRASDARGVFGDWGDPSPFSIPYPKIELIYPPEGEIVEVPTNKPYPIGFQWTAEKKVKGYILQIKDAATNEVKTYKSKDSQIKIPLRPGRDYGYRVSYLGVPENQLEDFPFTAFRVDIVKLDTPKIIKVSKKEVIWSKVKGARAYKVTLKAKQRAGDEWKVLFEKFNHKPNRLRLKGLRKKGSVYEITVVATTKGRPDSKPLVHEFNFRKTRLAEDALFGAKADYNHELIYGYIPMLQRYHLTQDEVESVLNVTMTNSNFLAYRYWFGGRDKVYGVELYYHRAQTELYEDGNNDVVSDGSQPLIPLATNTFALKNYYPFYRGPFSLGAELSIQRKNFYTFDQATPTTVQANENVTQEVIFGGHLYWNFGGWLDWDGAAIYGYHFGTEPSKVDSSDHLMLYGDLSHQIFFDNLVISYRYTYDYVSNVFTDEQGLPGQEAIIKSYQLGITGTILF